RLGARCRPASAPLLELQRVAWAHHEMAGERLALDREVVTEMDAAALLPRECVLCDETCERVRLVEQLDEPGGVSDQPPVPPELPSRVGVVSERRRIRFETRAAERGESGATAEDEALEQRV